MEGIGEILKLLSAAETLAKHPDLGPTNETLPRLIRKVKRNLRELKGGQVLEKSALTRDHPAMKIKPLECGPSRKEVGGRPPALEKLRQLHVKLPESRHAEFLEQCQELGAKPSELLRTLVYNYLEAIIDSRPEVQHSSSPPPASYDNDQTSRGSSDKAAG